MKSEPTAPSLVIATRAFTIGWMKFRGNGEMVTAGMAIPRGERWRNTPRGAPPILELPIFSLPRSSGSFLFRFGREEHLAVFLRVQQLLRLLRSHLPGVSGGLLLFF